MVRGINKQMIVLKIEGNRIYDSACFILKNEVKQSKDTERDMLNEANRILGEMDLRRVKRKRGGFFKRLAVSAILLIIGAIIGFGLSFLI